MSWCCAEHVSLVQCQCRAVHAWPTVSSYAQLTSVESLTCSDDDELASSLVSQSQLSCCCLSTIHSPDVHCCDFSEPQVSCASELTWCSWLISPSKRSDSHHCLLSLSVDARHATAFASYTNVNVAGTALGERGFPANRSIHIMHTQHYAVPHQYVNLQY